MAPIAPDLQNVQEDIKNVIQDLFQILAQVSNYDSAGRPSRDALVQDITALDTSLRAAHRTGLSLPPRADKGIPEPLIQYVENGRNPDIYTREFVELVRRMNQLTRGKAHAFRDFRDALAREMDSALPEVRDDVRRVLEATGGVTTEPKDGGGGGEGQTEGGGDQRAGGDGAGGTMKSMLGEMGVSG